MPFSCFGVDLSLIAPLRSVWEKVYEHGAVCVFLADVPCFVTVPEISPHMVSACQVRLWGTYPLPPGTTALSVRYSSLSGGDLQPIPLQVDQRLFTYYLPLGFSF